MKRSVLQANDALERKQALLDDVASERRQIAREKRTLMNMLKEVQQDLQTVDASFIHSFIHYRPIFWLGNESIGLCARRS